MPMLITCLGISGSGKTVFLGTLLDTLFSPANAINSFYILDRGSKGGAIMQDKVSIADISISSNLNKIGNDGFRGYPPGTKSTRLREFGLMQGKEVVLDIAWVDYKGGLITGDKTDQKEQDELYAVLEQSTAIVVYLDGYRIATAPTVAQARREVGADAISRILAHLESSKEGKMTNILVVLTQCDAIEDGKWAGPCGDYSLLKQKAKEVLGGLIEMINRNPLWHCGLVAVTAVGVGRNRRKILHEANFKMAAVVEDEIIGYPEPYNVINAFFWLVACEVAAQRQYEKATISHVELERRVEVKRVDDGRAKSRLLVQQEEQQRIRSLGFFKRMVETYLLEDDRQAKLNTNMSRAAAEYAESQKHIYEDIKDRLFSASTRLTKYESALQPLFNVSNNVVTKI